MEVIMPDMSEDLHHFKQKVEELVFLLSKLGRSDQIKGIDIILSCFNSAINNDPYLYDRVNISYFIEEPRCKQSQSEVFYQQKDVISDNIIETINDNKFLKLSNRNTVFLDGTAYSILDLCSKNKIDNVIESTTVTSSHSDIAYTSNITISNPQTNSDTMQQQCKNYIIPEETLKALGEQAESKYGDFSQNKKIKNNKECLKNGENITKELIVHEDGLLESVNQKRDINPEQSLVSNSAINLVCKDTDFRTSSSKEAPISCILCKIEISDISLFNDHQLKCFHQNFRCSYCNTLISSRVNFFNHTMQKKYPCEICKTTLCKNSDLRLHMKDEHDINLPSNDTKSCHICHKAFSKKSSLYYHYKIHATKDQKVCQKCGHFCNNQKSYDIHMQEHFNVAEFKCEKCREIFSRKQQYEKHIKTHGSYKCDYCPSTFSCKRKLHKHAWALHNKKPAGTQLDKQHSCSVCCKVFNRPSSLKVHLQMHSGIKHFKCDICNRQFNERRCYSKHLKSSIHEYHLFLISSCDGSVNSNFTAKSDWKFCSFCDLMIPGKLLGTHLSSAHSSKGTQCMKCGHNATSKEEYKAHALIHSNFICEMCGKIFSILSKLKAHIASCHSTQRSYKCQECDKDFKNRTTLTRHTKLHGLPIHKCTMCKAAFHQSYNLKRHMFTVHESEADERKKSKEDLSIKDFKDDASKKGLKDDSVKSNMDSTLVLTDDISSSHFTVFDSHLIQLVPSNFIPIADEFVPMIDDETKKKNLIEFNQIHELQYDETESITLSNSEPISLQADLNWV